MQSILEAFFMGSMSEIFRIGLVQDQNDPLQQAIKIFAETVAKETGGNIDVRVFPVSRLGDYQQMQESVQKGSLDAVIDDIASLSRYSPVAGIESMPYLFKDADQYKAVWNGPIGMEIKQKIVDDSNFRIVGHMYCGTRELTASRPINSIEDLKGLKVRVTPMMQERLVTWKMFGSSPTPMNWSEVFSSLRQGVIEAQENPLATIQSASLNEVQKYLILTSHMVSGFTFQFNDIDYRGWPDEKRVAIEAGVKAATDGYNEFIANEQSAILADLKEKGMTVIEIDRAPFRAIAKDVVAEFPDLQPWYEKLTKAAN